MDLVFILTGGVFMTGQAFSYTNEYYLDFMKFFLYPMAGLSMTGSTYTCVAISIERYLGKDNLIIKGSAHTWNNVGQIYLGHGNPLRKYLKINI